MLIMTHHEGKLEFNGHKLVNLKRPFRTKIDKKTYRRKKSEILVTPKEVLMTRKKRYVVQFSKYIFYMLHTISKSGVKSNGFYETPVKLSQVFRSKCVDLLLRNLESNDNTIQTIRGYFHKLIEITLDSYEFDYILTDVTTLHALKPTAPIKILNGKLIKPIEKESTTAQSVNQILNTFGEVPLNLLTQENLTNIKLEHTNINPNDYKDSNILFVTGQNHDYAGYIAQLMNKEIGIEQILPISLFIIRSSNSY